MAKTPATAKSTVLGDRFNFLKQHLPHLIVFDEVFGETMCEVPTDEIIQHLSAARKTRHLCAQASRRIFSKTKHCNSPPTFKKESGIPWSAIGVSGSILAGLTTTTSDIDPLVYGEENCRKAYTALQRMLKEGTQLQTLHQRRTQNPLRFPLKRHSHEL